MFTSAPLGWLSISTAREVESSACAARSSTPEGWFAATLTGSTRDAPGSMRREPNQSMSRAPSNPATAVAAKSWLLPGSCNDAGLVRRANTGGAEMSDSGTVRYEPAVDDAGAVGGLERANGTGSGTGTGALSGRELDGGAGRTLSP